MDEARRERLKRIGTGDESVKGLLLRDEIRQTSNLLQLYREARAAALKRPSLIPDLVQVEDYLLSLDVLPKELVVEMLFAASKDKYPEILWKAREDRDFLFKMLNSLRGEAFNVLFPRLVGTKLLLRSSRLKTYWNEESDEILYVSSQGTIRGQYKDGRLSGYPLYYFPDDPCPKCLSFGGEELVVDPEDRMDGGFVHAYYTGACTACGKDRR